MDLIQKILNNMLHEFKITSDSILKIYINDFSFESINLAIQSFRSNFEDIICKTEIVENINDANVIIELKKLTHDEEFAYKVTPEKLLFFGNDDLGVIFGLYTFLENELGVPPFYLIEGENLIKKNTINLTCKKVTSFPSSRFRGWFINDEDLLGSFKSISKRDIPDYPFYHDVINPEMMELIAETALRYRMNLIIPSTLINIMSEPERKLVEICSKRGLYVSQHHIEPLGVSKYGFKSFAKANGLNEDFSYLDNQKSMDLCYEAYVKEWSKFPRIIFQLGLRGAGDRPFWNNEKKVTTPEERGKIISTVINKQLDIVKKYYPGKIFATSTLWMEGADLLRRDLLNLSSEIVIVFADVGMSQLFGDDFFEVKRKPEFNYGVYYHAAYHHTGPHLAEGVIPEKMDYCYKLAQEKRSLYYSIINSCNVKELTFSLFLNSKLSWDSTIELDQIYQDYLSLFTDKIGQEKLYQGIKSYYDSLLEIGDDYYKYFCDKFNFSYHKYDNLPFPVVSMNDGLFKAIIYCFYYEQREKLRRPILREICSLGKKKMIKANGEFNDCLKYIPEEYRDGFKSHWIYQSLFFIHVFTSGEYFYDACQEASVKNFDLSKKLYELSSQELEKILKDRDFYFSGKYKNWLDNDHKIDIPFLVKRILEDYNRALEQK